MSALTQEQRARLVEVMARAIWDDRLINDGTQWQNASQRNREMTIEYAQAAISAAERAGFRIEGPA